MGAAVVSLNRSLPPYKGPTTWFLGVGEEGADEEFVKEERLDQRRKVICLLKRIKRMLQ